MVKYRCLECKKECDTYVTPNGTPFHGAGVPQSCRLSFCCGVLVEEIADDRGAAIRTAALQRARRQGLEEAAALAEKEYPIPTHTGGNSVYFNRGWASARKNIAKAIRTLAAAPPATGFLCYTCAHTNGWVIPAGHQPTIWEDRCTICGKIAAGTSLRDFGVTREMVEWVLREKQPAAD